MLDESLIIRAASSGDLEGVRAMLKDRSLGTQSSTLIEALNRAVSKGYLEIVKVLLENGADVNGRVKSGDAPLHYAVENLHPEVIKYLLEKGADVNAQDEFGITPLHQAIDVEAEYAKHLYDNGDPYSSPTILVSNLLIEAGADVNTKTKKGETPLRWALDQWHKPAEALLLEYGAHL
jgi:ankyrin repeat protein